MSTITFRLERGLGGGWSDRSDLTLHLEDWDLEIGPERITGKPRPASLFWRLFTLVFFGVLGFFMLFRFTPFLWFELATAGPATAPREVALRPVVYQDTSVPPHLRTPQPTVEDVQRQTEKVLEHLSPEARRRVEEEVARKQRERAARQQEQQARWDRIDRYVRIFGWCVSPLVIGFGLVTNWIGFRYGLLEIIRFPFDRLEIDTTDSERHGERVLRLRRPKLKGQLQLIRPMSQLQAIGLSTRKIGRHSSRTHSSPSYHWVVTLISTRASDLPRIELFVDSQRDPPSSPTAAPHRVKQVIATLQGMTGCTKVIHGSTGW